ncbi:hypothetical protein A3A46_02850 [Candidatus Roizmanbacteria bacterium RIFCSPLOWO2_01_FULL_37_13]|uniref:Uncharacterized protein n=1 Tax=Candidatus Roizmanbacteria bacterium RIFCSPHIGHO2_02_FULL_38_11 TaxID=1802039 RepID=A0A1F7H218_9BACT|nr:MAG: hypothetical protein A3C25_00070 [Candidatus Roizmanbacteria bacterium RIFCSPHIGHO2_02_FULL_38_11]OGK34268.1 MAG: hypothetical protein A3F58_02920 [Candidatus Roizmanbacteria bacterium RIFCSPHIGHO2_12_FULL_37_9b]OGK43062.1 MAG: hypothetical protein A3A46_02850 [Candidatus Roizmanbacteria bacterium RIFCSPLOWO2_01_FULL_37_13]
MTGEQSLRIRTVDSVVDSNVRLIYATEGQNETELGYINVLTGDFYPSDLKEKVDDLLTKNAAISRGDKIALGLAIHAVSSMDKL